MATQFDPIAKDESLNTTEATPRNIADVIAEGLKGIEDALPTYTEGDGIDISAQKVISVDTTFTEASTRANITSGDSLSTIWGKIKKFFTDLKAVAFSGAAADVTYDNTASGLTSTDVQDAIDALNDDLTNTSSDVASLLTKINFQSSIMKITVGQSGTTFNIFIYTTNLQQAFYLLSFTSTNISYYTWDGSAWVLLWNK